MKTMIKFLFTLLILFAFSCSQETTLDTLPTELEAVSAKANLPSDVLDISDGTTVLGSATLHRNKNGITVNVKTTGLIKGNVYTLWIIPFNNPAICASELGCTPGELIAAMGDSIYGTGHVVGGNGKGNFSAHLSVGDVGVTGNGLIYPQTAEIHVVVRDHGPKIPGMVSEQISLYAGGCDTNVCADIQFAIFLAD